MKVVVQRVSEARVEVGEEVVGKIGRGMAVLVGIYEKDGMEEAEWMCKKIRGLRIFNDEKGKMNESIEGVGGELLIVSQFTLCGDAAKGNRPSYMKAAKPENAEKLYEWMIEKLKEDSGLKVESGRFGASMDLFILNEGPVTIILER